MSSKGSGSRKRQRQVAAADLFVLGDDGVQCVLEHLDSLAFFQVAATCRALRRLCHQPVMLAQLPLGDKEDPRFSVFVERQRLLERLAASGNAVACYRLGIAKVYHPILHSSGFKGVEEGTALLRRAMVLGEPEVRADAAFELWLLTRRHPHPIDSSESLLQTAIAEGHNPALFSVHRPRERQRELDCFRVSGQFAAMQEFLVAALQATPTCPLSTSRCCNPGCGRWGVRAREVRRLQEAGFDGALGPPGLPRCQGLHGSRCRTRYCSRFCQAMHWPEHRKECSIANL
jgi:hypothetical protein